MEPVLYGFLYDFALSSIISGSSAPGIVLSNGSALA
jgi:hypothetical protein